jgi:hypothetical protein
MYSFSGPPTAGWRTGRWRLSSRLFRTKNINRPIADSQNPEKGPKETLGSLRLTSAKGTDRRGSLKATGESALIARRVGTLALLLLAAVALTISVSFGWGETAQRLITNKAVDTLPEEMVPFFEANRQFLVEHVTEPDGVKPDDHTGFIQLDHYGQYPFSALPHSYSVASLKFSKHVLEEYGVLPWQIGIASQKLTDDLRNHEWGEAKLSAATLAHFVAAADDPFNTTVNFDGHLSDQPGVNERYDTGLVDRYQLFFFVKPNQASYISEPTDRAFDMCIEAHSWLENILIADHQAHKGLTSYADDYYDRFYAQAGAILIRQLSDASTDVGSYWMTAWINAGRPQLPSR